MHTSYFHFLHQTTRKEIVEIKKDLNFINTMSIEVVYDYKKIRKQLSQSSFRSIPPSTLKYALLYPITTINKSLSLQEGGTPLYQSKNLYKTLGIKKLYFKNEGMNPTGAFKDRGTFVEISKAIEYKAKGVVVASTGNMAASVAAYCARVGIPCYIFVPANTPVTKLMQTLFYGGNIIKVKGGYDQAARLAKEVAEEYNFYLAGDYLFRCEGQKSQAYEIIEQLDFVAPDYVIVPVGNGTNIFSIWKGFTEFKTMGLIEKIPHMIAVQAQTHNAIVTAFKNNSCEILPSYIPANGKTVASAIAVKNPLDGAKVLKLLQQTEGNAIAVNDEEMLRAQIQLAATESLFVEPSSASVIAALPKLVANGTIKQNENVVCLLSGDGFKDPFSAARYLEKQLTIEPDLSIVKKIFKRKKWIK